MKTQTSFSQSVLRVGLVTTLLLMIPLIAMQFSVEVNWNIFDFVVMGALIFSIGMSCVLAMRHATDLVYKVAIAFSLGSLFFLIWANLAVGLIGGGPNPGNLMYIGVVAIGIIGTALSRFTPGGMERTMYAMAFALVIVAIIALLTNMSQYPGSSAVEIIGVNTFFIALFAISGLLFRYVVMEQLQRTEKSEG